MVFWSVAVNKTAIHVGEGVKDDGTGEIADEISLEWEKKWLEAMKEIQDNVNKDEMDFYYVTGRRFVLNSLSKYLKGSTLLTVLIFSFGDVYKLTMYNDMKIVVVGYMIMFVYVAINLGRFNMIEQRVRQFYTIKDFLFLGLIKFLFQNFAAIFVVGWYFLCRSRRNCYVRNMFNIWTSVRQRQQGSAVPFAWRKKLTYFYPFIIYLYFTIIFNIFYRLVLMTCLL